MNGHRSRRALAAGLTLALGAAIVSAAPASAEGSNWWYDYYSVGEVHADGWTGKGVTIAVMDDGINPATPALQGTDLTVDPEGLCEGDDGKPRPGAGTEMSRYWHGTNVTSYIIGNGTGPNQVQGIAPDAKVLFYADAGEDEKVCSRAADWSSQVYEAVDAGADIITTSVGWASLTPDGLSAVAYALAKGVVFLAAQPNSQLSIYEYPAKLNGVVQVSAYNAAGQIESDEDLADERAIHADTTVVAPGEGLLSIGNEETGNWDESVEMAGTSFATPMVAAALADVWQKYPKATSNQLIQSLIHNTTLEDHPLLRDTESGYGYGPMSLRHMLRVDPTQYPDVNPLFDKDYAKPTSAEVDAITAKIAAGEDAHPKKWSSFDEYSESRATTPSLLGALSGIPLWLVIGAGVLALIVLAGIVLTIVLIARRNKPGSGATP